MRDIEVGKVRIIAYTFAKLPRQETRTPIVDKKGRKKKGICPIQ